MNNVILMGRLVRDPDVRYSQQGQTQLAIARFTLAVDRRRRKEGEQSADFISCVTFGKIAEFAEKYTRKGTKVVVEGRWQTGSYKNKDGATIYTNDCIVESMEFAESKKAESDEQPRPEPTPTDDFMKIPDNIGEELPFNQGGTS